uniref:hypothetical protein n=1 Tax=Amycolatopsis sp. CA-096443 TaxID=3239919 RepID=UPI003F493257
MPVTTYVTFPGDEDRTRLHHVYDAIDGFAEWLNDKGHTKTAASVVARYRGGDLHGTTREEVRADWRDLAYFGDVQERELRHDQARLLGLARSIMEEWAELVDEDRQRDTVWTYGEIDDWGDITALGTANDDETVDIVGPDWVWVKERVQEWLWAVTPPLSKWDASNLSLTSFRAFLLAEGAQ